MTTTTAPAGNRIRRLVVHDRPTQVFGAALLGALVLFYVVGRHQWFVRDDWAFLLSRQRLRQQDGIGAWLLTPQDGHWMTPPLAFWRLLQNVFGVGSYWPYLVPTMALHIVAVLLVRMWCRRLGVSAWTTTVGSILLLVFGTGWEDIVFAVQLVYNLSLVCFLAHLRLVDHDGPVDRRDVVGSALGLLSITSSGFGPFFLVGVGVLLVLRRRWVAAAVAVGPQALAYLWWWVAWGGDPTAERHEAGVRSIVRYAREMLSLTLGGMTGQEILGGAALLGIVAVCVWRGRLDWRRRSVLLALAATVVVMFGGIAVQRAGLGLASAASGRYQYMAAMLLVPALGLAVDQVRRFDRYALLAVHMLLVVSVAQNARALVRWSDQWADVARADQRLFETVAGFPGIDQADQRLMMSDFNPDVLLADLPLLVADGAITPRTDLTHDEQQIVVDITNGKPVHRTP